ncbi:MAG TPA: SpoIIE family protein phosphatase [Terracidiphilus sp.]
MDSSAQLAFLSYTDSEGAHTFPLRTPTVSIGRQTDQDLRLRDGYVSRRHALIRLAGSAYEVVDQNSSLGTFVNGARVSRAGLRPGDIIQLGSPSAIKLRFNTGTPAPQQREPSLAEDLLGALSRISLEGKNEPAPAGEPGRELAQLNFLLSAARKLNSGPARTDILHALLQLSIQLTGVERGFVFLRDDTRPEQGDAMRLALGLRSDGTPLLDDTGISHRAIHSALHGSSRFYVSDTRADAARSESVIVNFIRSIFCIPLRKRSSAAHPGTLLGLLYLDSQADAARLNSIDHELLETIANEAATLLENALLAEREMRARQTAEELAIAARIHAGLMSVDLPQAPYAALEARAVPCSEIGGDFYDAVLLPDALGIVIADVSGKGIPASIVAATLQGIIHAQFLANQPLTAIAAVLNRFLCTRSVGKYATAVLMKLHPGGELEWVNCGHIQPLLVSNGSVTSLLESNLMVGLIAEATYTAASTRLQPGDSILLATDGILEAENAREEQFGTDRFHACAASANIHEILQLVKNFHDPHPAQDDCTLLHLRYLAH